MKNIRTFSKCISGSRPGRGDRGAFDKSCLNQDFSPRRRGVENSAKETTYGRASNIGMRDGERGELWHAWWWCDPVESRDRTVAWHLNPALAQIGNKLIRLMVGGTDPGGDSSLAGLMGNVIGDLCMGIEWRIIFVDVGRPHGIKLQAMLKYSLSIGSKTA